MKFSFKRAAIKWRHWEYWPFGVVYAPIFFYWFWLCLKARSFFFFSAANPAIRNGGFLMESKKEIYDSLPPGTYPKTCLCGPQDDFCSIKSKVQTAGLEFPLIAKPDIGMRGTAVKLLHNMGDLKRYAAQSRVDFLIQEFIDYPCEAGIFYYRMPGEKSGHISGIVGKEFLTVTGNGRQTIRQLALQNNRAVLQLPALETLYGSGLQTVPAPGEAITLVPCGNHCRGAKFLNLTHQATPELAERIDALCQQIPQFYFGRLDVKFQSWEALCAGGPLSVIEVNGAGSEPAHIYDPRHSIFFGWAEIVRHLRILYRISIYNKRHNGVSYMPFRDGLQMHRDHRKQQRLLASVV